MPFKTSTDGDPWRDDGWDSAASRAVVEMLKLLLKARSEQHDVAQRLIATSDDVEAIALSDEPDR